MHAWEQPLATLRLRASTSNSIPLQTLKCGRTAHSTSASRCSLNVVPGVAWPDPPSTKTLCYQSSRLGYCTFCKTPDILQQGLSAWMQSVDVWRWTRGKTAVILRTDERCIAVTWITFPNFSIWPRPKLNAVLWLLGHMTHYVTDTTGHLTFLDYTDFLRQDRWKLHLWNKRQGCNRKYYCWHNCLLSVWLSESQCVRPSCASRDHVSKVTSDPSLCVNQLQ